MVYRYKRKTTRAEWSEDTMEEALKKIKSDKLPIRRAADEFNIPYATLRKHYYKDSSCSVFGLLSREPNI